MHMSEELSMCTMTAPVNRKRRSVHSSFLPMPMVSKLRSRNWALAQEEILSLLPVSGAGFFSLSQYLSLVLRSMWRAYIAKRFPPVFSVGVWMILPLIRFSWQAFAGVWFGSCRCSGVFAFSSGCCYRIALNINESWYNLDVSLVLFPFYPMRRLSIVWKCKSLKHEQISRCIIVLKYNYHKWRGPRFLSNCPCFS